MPQRLDRKLSKPVGTPKLEYDVCSRCGSLFDDQGENGWWFEENEWWHECNLERPAKIVVRRLPRVA